MYKNILVAVDGSREALKALKRAINIAKLEGAKLIIAHVIELPTHLELNTIQAKETNAMVENINIQLLDIANNLLSEYKEIALEDGLNNVETILEQGNPKKIIPKKIALDYECDLIVCGAQGLNALEHFFLGSVSENILRRATCDVLIVRSHEEIEDKE